MKGSFSLWQGLTLLALLLPTAYLLWAWPTLPAYIPSHFGPDGIDGYTSRNDAWVLTTALPLGVYLLLLFLPRFDPRRRVAADSRSYHKMGLLIVGSIGALACYSIYLALHPGMQPGRGLNVGMALFFVALGNYLTTVPPNYFMGVRTPWALESDLVWTKTHRLMGRVFFSGGLLAVLVGLFAPESAFMPAFIALVLGGTVLAYGYSYWVYRRVLQAAE
jgi:uncharacterized membrane protein